MIAVNLGLVPAAQIPLVLLSLMPAIMFFANKSASLVMVICALTALVAKVHDGGGKASLGLAKGWLRASRSLTIGLALGLACLSASQSPETVRSLDILAGTALVSLGCLVSVIEAPRTDTVALRRFAVITLVVLAVAIIAEEASGMWAHRVLGLRSEAFALKRPVICSTIVFLSLLDFARRHFTPSFVVAASLLQLGAIAAAHSGAAAFGVIGFVGGVLCCRLLGARSAKAVLLVWVSGCLLVAPVIGTILVPFKDGRIVAHLEAFHLRERIEIWNAFDIALRDEPIVGYGFGASQEVIEAVAQKRGFDQAMDVARNIHPHNAYLQVWVEMGLVGTVLALAAMALCVSRLDSRAVAFTNRFGIWSFCCVLMLLSHSLWQTWWIASIGAAATWLRVDEVDRPGDGAVP